MKKLIAIILLSLSAPAFATLSNESSYIQYTGDGSTKVFSFTFPTQATTDIEVLVNGSLYLGAYTVVLNPNQTSSPGGSVTFSSAPGGFPVLIRRTVPLTQQTTLNAATPFPAKTMEKSMDRLVTQSQRLKREIDDMGVKVDGAISTHTTDKNLQTAIDAAQDAKWTAILAGLNGTSHAVTDTSSVLAAGSSNPRTLTVRFSDTIELLDFTGADPTGATDSTTALQNAINAAYGKKLHLNRGDYHFCGPLTIQPIYGGTSQLPIALVGDGYDANGGSGGTILRNTCATDGIRVQNVTGQSADAPIILKDFALLNDGVNGSGGTGVVADMVNNLGLIHLWIQGWRENGAKLTDCWESLVESVTFLRNRRHGLHINGRFNAGTIRRVHAFGNGRVYDAQHAGIYFSGAGGYENLGPRMEQVDVSYNGSEGYKSFHKDLTGAPNPITTGETWVQLTDINVTTGPNVATVTTASAHGLANGNYVAVSGATFDRSLNSKYLFPITVDSATQFHFTISGFPVPAHDFVESSLVVSPVGYGLLMDSTRGAVITNLYCENPAGPCVYLGGAVKGFVMSGGYFQNGPVLIDAALNGTAEGGFYTGVASGIYVTNGGRDVPNVGNNTFDSGAYESYAMPYKKDGRYIGSGSFPGSWNFGDLVWNYNPSAGNPVGWVCVANGSPGTWLPFGGPGSSQANSTAVDVAGLKTDFNALLAKLRATGILGP